ncbi:copper-transporting ATPase 1, putative [Eimeria praecox]|uniref:Copper-transporting ATPase 1, putative n=1 Tax=Eimeria praecox TaxID=51316 RepID=U6H229_9EIME|nr:copper-transporting ATPase 1, putative [Eimeria praecox]
MVRPPTPSARSLGFTLRYFNRFVSSGSARLDFVYFPQPLDTRMPPVAVCELLVGGMTCAACTGAVQGSLIKCPGAIQAQVDLLRETARVAYNSDKVSPAELCAAVENLGFQAQVLQIFVASNASPDADRPVTTTDSADLSADEQREPSKEPLCCYQADRPGADRPGVPGCTEEHAEPRRPQYQEASKQTHDFSELWAMSKATLCLALTDSQGLSVESACSTLKSSKGVMGCAVTPLRDIAGTGMRQLMVTYKPQVVGARELLMKLLSQGYSPSILSEDPLQKQARTSPCSTCKLHMLSKEAVLGNQRAMISSLLLSLLPALAVVCLSVMARTHTLPASLLRECIPGVRLSNLLLLLLSTPVQFYGGRSFHRAALKGLRHRQFSMDLLVSLGSNLAFFYSALSCMQSAATSMRCRPLLSAADAAAAATAPPGDANSSSYKSSPFYELLDRAEPQVFLDTCAMLICVVLVGKLLQLRAKARILEQLHSLHSLQVRRVHWVLRSEDTAVARCLHQSAQHSSSSGGEEEQTSNSVQIPHELLKIIADATTQDTPDDDAIPPPLPVRWWRKISAVCRMQKGRHSNTYNPLTQPASWGVGDEGEEILDRQRRPCCSQMTDLTEPNETAASTDTQATQESPPSEIIISAELLQAGDVVRVPPQEVLPADGILLAPQVLHVDERLVSGEGRGVAKLAGQRVGDASVLQTLLRLVETGQQQQQPLQKAAEKFATYFIPIVLCITAVAVAAWVVRVFAAADTLPLSPLQQMRQRLLELELREGVSSSDLQQQLQHHHQQQQQVEAQDNFLRPVSPVRSTPISPAMEAPPASAHAAAAAAAACRLSSWVITWDSLLFALRFGVAVCCAACPCAIGLAAPAAVAAATAAAAARGVFFKSGKALEAAANVNCLVVDKTGTLTTGDLRVTACVLHTKRLERILLPAMERSRDSLHASDSTCKTNDESGGSVCSTTGATSSLKRGSCCRGSSLDDSMDSEDITLEGATPLPEDTSATSTDKLSPPCCRKQLLRSSSNLDRPCGSYAAAAILTDHVGGPLPFANSISCGRHHLLRRKETATAPVAAAAAGAAAAAAAMGRRMRAHSLLQLPLHHHPRLVKNIDCCLEALKGSSGQEEGGHCVCVLLQPLQKTEWTSWHESHCGPVVHLHAWVAADREGCGEPSVSSGAWVWLGSVALQDEIQQETKLAVEYLRRCLGFRIFMCTGDNYRTASRVGAAFSIPEDCIVAQQTPEDKVRFLRSLATPPTQQTATTPTANNDSSSNSNSSSSSTSCTTSLLRREKEKPPVCCMVGDGLNDSPALAEAALGVAFGVGNALPLAAAAVAVGGRSWTELIDLFRLARQTRSIIWWNLLWACVFNLVSVPLAAGVAYPTVSLHPAAAAAAMACSCLLVLLNAQRLTRFKGTTAEDMTRELSKVSTDIEPEEENGEQQQDKSPQSAASLQLNDEEDCSSFSRSFGDDILSLPPEDPLAATSCCCQPGAELQFIRPLELPIRKQDGTFLEFSDFEA